MTSADQHPATVDPVCGDCGGSVQAVDGDLVCADCGLVVETTSIDHGKEWRSFDADDRKRTGPPRTATRHDNGLGSEIGYRKDAKGNTLSASNHRALNRQRTLHSQARAPTSRDKTESSAQTDIGRLASQLDLSDEIVEQSGQLWKTVQKNDLHIGLAYETVAAAVVYAVCRLRKQGRDLEEIASYTDAEVEFLRTIYRKLVRELELPVPLLTAVESVEEVVGELEMSAEARATAFEYGRAVATADAGSALSPSGVGAACVWLAVLEMDGDVRQKEIAEAASTTGTTIRRAVGRVSAVDAIPSKEEARA